MVPGKAVLPLILRFLALAVLLSRLLFISHPIPTDQWWVLCTALATYLATYAWDYIAFLKFDSPPNQYDGALFQSIQALMPPDRLMPYFAYLQCVQTPFVYKDIEGLHRYVDNWGFGDKEFVDKQMERARKDLFAKASVAIKNINTYA
jgi:hypothetical protein